MSPVLALSCALLLSGAPTGDRAAAPDLPDVPRYAIKVAKAVTASADDRVFDNAVILVSNGKIEKVGRAVDVPIPAGYEVVDAGTKWALPGFVDCHDHSPAGCRT
jgi:imidazolonepropionase-like amidohydrolase